MAATEEEICNSALSKIGAEPIVALADNNKRARTCNNIFDAVRKKILREHPWNFAMKRVALVEDVSTPAFEYAKQFVLPVDYLRAVREEYKDVDFKIESGLLLTNESAFNLLYIADVTDVTAFDPSFDELFALYLAKELAYPLVQSITLMEALERQYMTALRDVRSTDAQEGTPEELETSEWLDARL